MKNFSFNLLSKYNVNQLKYKHVEDRKVVLRVWLCMDHMWSECDVGLFHNVQLRMRPLAIYHCNIVISIACHWIKLPPIQIAYCDIIASAWKPFSCIATNHDVSLYFKLHSVWHNIHSWLLKYSSHTHTHTRARVCTHTHTHTHC